MDGDVFVFWFYCNYLTSLYNDLTNQSNTANAIKPTSLQNQQLQKEDSANQNIAFLKGQISALLITANSKSSLNSDSYKESELLTNAFNKFSSSISKKNSDSISLKKRALMLSKELLQFISDRQKQEPIWDNKNSDKSNQELENHENESRLLCESQFIFFMV